MESQNEQQPLTRRVTPESSSSLEDSRPIAVRRSSHSSLRLEEDISEAIMPSYKSLGRQSKAQSNLTAATQTPQQHFTYPYNLLQSYLKELEHRRYLCAQQNGGRLDLGTAEILNTIGLHYHHVTNDQEKALACHNEALDVLRQVIKELLGPTSPRPSPGASAGDEPPPLPGSTVLTTDQEAQLKEAYVQKAITYTDVGNAYKWRGDNDNALRAYDEALAVFRELGMSEDHPRVAATLRCVKRIGQRFEGGASILPSYLHSNS
eukprot:CAMPEP_0197726004 /NCGR_PEP_ID=MMETSP1434-20131217/12400_1 /TAXON_ID=265543 /ORGANISM="Minutocellus polymorphus, Strain CCMP3303" /LENGTH=262 /DNA_ID=CAMNT_0043311779 /DNA_START=351 /DNA_END=1139 /DNA_ORIENTATION=-